MSYTDCGISGYGQLALERMVIDDKEERQGRFNYVVEREIRYAMSGISDFFNSENLLAVLREQDVDWRNGERTIMERITWAAMKGDVRETFKANAEAIEYLLKAVIESPHTEHAIQRLKRSMAYSD